MTRNGGSLPARGAVSFPAVSQHREELDRSALEQMLRIAQHLSASAGLTEILAVIINAMRDTLQAERATVFEYDAEKDELFTTVAHGLGDASKTTEHATDATEAIRISAKQGLAGQCAQEQRIVNVPDAYADPRFNQEVDRKTGFRTRSILAIPLLDPEGKLIGVSQVLNKRDRPFDERDERVALALASLAAVAIKRGRLIEDRLVREKLERDLTVARQIQQRTFPRELPDLPGFELDAWSEPAEETGGDAFDVIPCPDEGAVVNDAAIALLILADATGHGIGPALSVTQVRSMMRMAARLAAGSNRGLQRIARDINNQLCEDLPEGRFITAWLGMLDVETSTITSGSAGQAPILHFSASRGEFEQLDADAVPFGVTTDLDIDHHDPVVLEPGDIFAVISDGVFEALDPSMSQFGTDRVLEIIAAHHLESPAR
ncbi:MAG: PP2C family protein-serine/threonine phosphatase, partial [Planctomycetota bacterium]